MGNFKSSLLYKLALVFVIVAALPFTLTALLFYIHETSLAEKWETHTDEKKVQVADYKLDAILSSCLIDIQSLAQTYCIENAQCDSDHLLAEIKRIVDFNKYIDDISVLDNKGRVLASVNYDYTGDWMSKSWYLEALKGNAVFSPVYLQVIIPECTVSLNVPVIVDKSVVRVVSANFDLGSLWADVLSGEEDGSSFFILVDKECRVIRHPESKFLLEKFPDKAVSDMLITASDKISRFKAASDVYELCYVQKLSCTYPETDFGWRMAYIKTHTDVASLNSPILLQIFVIAVLVLVFIFVVAIVFARGITGPIAAVTSAADRIAEGDYNISLDVNSSDEIGELRKSINEMALKLQTATTTKNELAGEVYYYEHIEKQLKKAKKKAEIANKAKDDFLACVSHEVRTPLNAIIGYTESLIMDTSDPDYSAKLRTILAESEHLLCLLNDILDNAKIQSGKLDIELRPCDLVQTIEEIRQLVEPKAVNKGLDFSVRLDQMPAYVITDQLRLRQVILNLVSNAVKFTNIGGIELIVNVVNKENNRVRLKFSVVDTGIGISKDRQQNIFESYIQADSSISRTYGGTGLGTTISRSIVGLLGGIMGVESELGVGSTFWFELPMDLCNQQEAESILKEQVQNDNIGLKMDFSSLKVLLVEDYHTNRNLIVNQLSRLNIKCDIAENGRQAVDLVCENTYDLILMDLQMPVMDGISATRLIRSMPEKDKLIIIAMTASVEQSIKTECLEAGMDDIVCKPLKMAKFVSLFEKWFAGSRTIDNTSGPLPKPAVALSETENSSEWDRQLALELFGNNQMLLEMSLNNYLADVQELITSINDAISEGDYEKIRSNAHKIKGGASCLAADKLSQIAGKLEELANIQQPDNMNSVVSELAVVFSQFRNQSQ